MKNLGAGAWSSDLKSKGVHGDLIDKAVDLAYDEVNEEKQARDYLGRKRLRKPRDQKQAARIFRQLMRAGFGAKTIFTILKKWDVDEETLSALEEETVGITPGPAIAGHGEFRKTCGVRRGLAGYRLELVS